MMPVGPAADLKIIDCATTATGDTPGSISEDDAETLRDGGQETYEVFFWVDANHPAFDPNVRPRFFSFEGQCFEVIGIAPDVQRAGYKLTLRPFEGANAAKFF